MTRSEMNLLDLSMIVPFAMMAYIYLEVTFIEQKLLLVISLVSYCLCVCLYVCLSYCLSVPFTMMAYIYLEVTLSEQKLLLVISLVSYCLSVCLSLCLSFCLYLCLSVFLSVCSLSDDGLHLSVGHLYRAEASLGHQFGELLKVCLSVLMSVYLYVSLFFCLSVLFAMMAYIYSEVTFIEQKLLLVISSVSYCLYVCPSVCLYVCLSYCLFVLFAIMVYTSTWRSPSLSRSFSWSSVW